MYNKDTIDVVIKKYELILLNEINQFNIFQKNYSILRTIDLQYLINL